MDKIIMPNNKIVVDQIPRNLFCYFCGKITLNDFIVITPKNNENRRLLEKQYKEINPEYQQDTLFPFIGIARFTYTVCTQCDSLLFLAQFRNILKCYKRYARVNLNLSTLLGIAQTISWDHFLTWFNYHKSMNHELIIILKQIRSKQIKKELIMEWLNYPNIGFDIIQDTEYFVLDT